ncbi:hypothetical protein DFH07DRAFT_966517 [Mycena maculata]|uniref:Uncharacterized protein n=1 Tax=Mycena maculata TaxID=230809 RepID=A0AAD7I9V2_9AGAR|nr:hypothetical protein DFH07DRAFT_966517 [Mycena maculata]
MAHTQARWLQVLLSIGQDPTTNAMIIPASVIEMAATGISVATGNNLSSLPPFIAADNSIGHIVGMIPLSIMAVFRLGYFTQITRFPNDGVGLSVFVNEDVGQYTNNIIKYRLIDEIFGRDWTRHKDEAAEAGPAVAALTNTPSPINASLPSSLASVEGKYRNLGYGPDITLCAPSVMSSKSSAVLAHLNSTSPAELAQADRVWDWDHRVYILVSRI